MKNMKKRWIAAILLTTTVIGLFAYASAQAPARSRACEGNGDFLVADGDVALLGAQWEEEHFLNVAATDENGNATFQIVYNLDSSWRVQDQCETLAADIHEETGVTVPVVHSSMYPKDYEILVGNAMRLETIDRVNEPGEQLTFHITETCRESVETGLPVMRHMILGWQSDEKVWDIEDEYMFGDAFLIAPVLKQGATSREVYLPEGKWEDLNTGAVYTVGRRGETVIVNASIAEIPTSYNVNTKSETAAEDFRFRATVGASGDINFYTKDVNLDIYNLL